MTNFQENLKHDIKELVEKYQHHEISLSDINEKIPETLSNILATFENPELSISNSITSQRKYMVITNGIKSYYTETRVTKLRKKNNANMLLDMPRRILVVQFFGFNKKFDFEKLTYPSQQIFESGMTMPGAPLNQNKHWSKETFKRYIFTTRHLLKDNKNKLIIKTSKGMASPLGSYYFNPRLKFVVIKNQKSTSDVPSINESNLE